MFPIISSNLVVNTDRILALALGSILKLSRFWHIRLGLNDIGFCIGLEPFIIALVRQEELTIAFQIVKEPSFTSRFRERGIISHIVVIGFKIIKA